MPPARTYLTWRLGYHSGSGGVETPGSRLQWELRHWEYPIPQEGKAQEQDPDDNTADGADLLAAERYAVMSYLRPMPVKQDEDESPEEMQRIFREHGAREQAPRRTRRSAHMNRPYDEDFGDL